MIETTLQIALLASESVHEIEQKNPFNLKCWLEKDMIRISMIRRGNMKWSMRALFRENLA